MILNHLQLHNYRRFERFDIDFHPELTVIAARNGQGKTTILEAIAAALGPFVGAFDNGRAEHIRRTDARYASVGEGYENEQNFPVSIKAHLSEPYIQWQRALHSAKGRTTIKESAPLAEWGKRLQMELRSNAELNLPVVRYYSSKRLWVSHKNVESKSILTKSRTTGYEDCLSSMSSFVQLQEWFKKATQAVSQQRDMPGYTGANFDERIQGVRNAVDTVMQSEQWSHFHYSYVFDELAMIHPDHGALPINILSDGVRAMISLVADLALRCVRLNGHLGSEAPKETTGIVLIDEVDLHLHPAWQQKVLTALREAFPKIQFIVSSHSPQVLTTVNSSNIRVVFQSVNGEWCAQQPCQEILGMESSIALNDIMGVNPIPPIEEANLIANYIAAIEQGQHETSSAVAIRDQLLAIYGPGHAVLRDADRLIRFQSFKLRQQGNMTGQD